MSYDVKLFVPVTPVTKPRTTKKSWFTRAARFMGFRDAFQTIYPRPEEVRTGTHQVDIVFLEWKSSQDLDNLAKAVLDCLGGGFLFPSDSIKYIRKQSYEAVGDGKGEGFIVHVRSIHEDVRGRPDSEGGKPHPRQRVASRTGRRSKSGNPQATEKNRQTGG